MSSSTAGARATTHRTRTRTPGPSGCTASRPGASSTRATTTSGGSSPTWPYTELVDYLRHHTPDAPDRVFATLGHFDGVHFARRATAPALFSAGLMDPVCPPSTVHAAFRQYAGDKQITEWPFADHAGGKGANAVVQLRWLRGRGLAPARRWTP
ncbi:acetylxylan esterase [Streptomyces sp. NPDC093595]|uniref:acetylxylan esterase n=1 Tax=Streptomyces sp. NPDC093595 TaxID=3366045 RepID=UPI00381A0516